MAFSPDETDSPLIVDADRVLTLPSAPQGFEPVARRHAEVLDLLCVVQQTKLP
jgi:hypothetical protein